MHPFDLPEPDHAAHALVCETCESEIDFPDAFAERGVCRHCGLAFFVEVPAARSSRAS